MNDLFDPKAEETAVSAEAELLRIAIDKNLDAEKLGKIIDLFNKQQDRMRKDEFDANFSKLRAALRPVVKSKENTFLKSKYAPLEELQAACDEIIFQHGFSYSWREEALEGGKRIWIDITGFGHTKSNYFDTPDMTEMKSREGGVVANILQVRGIQTTYGQRYTYKSGFGIVIAGEDSDASIPDDLDTLRYNFHLLFEDNKTLNAPAVQMVRDELAKDNPDMNKLSRWYSLMRKKVGK